MSTLTLLGIRDLVKSDLNEGTTMLSDAELNILANDGYKDTAVKGLCYENKIAKDNIAAEKIVSLVGSNVIRVNYVEYKTGTTEGGTGMMCVLPQTIGSVAGTLVNTTNGTGAPQRWFQWGEYLVIDPVPDVATYDLAVYAACYPAAIMSSDSDTPSSLPVEFHECVYLFTLAYAALKLKRWADAANAYNRYIAEVQRKRGEYVMKQPDSRLARVLPDTVTMEAR